MRLSDNVQNDLEGHGPLTPYIIQNKRLPRHTFVPNLMILCQIFDQLSMENQIASRTVHVSRTVHITWSGPYFREREGYFVSCELIFEILWLL